MNVIHAVFSPAFRMYLAGLIKQFGAPKVKALMITDGYHPAFVEAICKSILRREGW